MKKKQTSEFLSSIEEIAQQANELVSASIENRSFILIATENDGKGTATMIGFSGKSSELIKGLVQFGQQEKSNVLLDRALNRLALEKIASLMAERLDKDDESEKDCEKVEKEGE